MSRWAKLIWFIAIAFALLVVAVGIYVMNKAPSPLVPVPSGPPLAPPPRAGGSVSFVG
jgi:hypothetical protein